MEMIQVQLANRHPGYTKPKTLKSLLTFYRNSLVQQTETAADMAALKKRKEKKRHDIFDFVFLVLSNLTFISIELLTMSKTASNTGIPSVRNHLALFWCMEHCCH